jgi:hypothetical protein
MASKKAEGWLNIIVIISIALILGIIFFYGVQNIMGIFKAG